MPPNAPNPFSTIPNQRLGGMMNTENNVHDEMESLSGGLRNNVHAFEFPELNMQTNQGVPGTSRQVSAPMGNNPSTGQFTNVTWKPKEPQVFHGKNTEDVHSWTDVVTNYYAFMQGTPQQEVAYAATLLRDSAHDWWKSYLRKNGNKYPRDWPTMSLALIERFGSHLREKEALANIMFMRQNKRNVREYSADFENCVGKLTSYDEATLIQIYIWGLERELAEKVSVQNPKTLSAAIGFAEDIELAIKFAHRPPVKGQSGVSQSSSQVFSGNKQSNWRGGQCGGRWNRGGSFGGRRGGALIGRGRGQMPQPNTFNNSVGGNGGFNPNCYYCGRPGHISRNCPQRINTGFARGRGSRGGRTGGRRTHFAGLGTVNESDEFVGLEDQATSSNAQEN